MIGACLLAAALCWASGSHADAAVPDSCAPQVNRALGLIPTAEPPVTIQQPQPDENPPPPPSPASPPDEFVVTGRVVDAVGLPVAGVEVRPLNLEMLRAWTLSKRVVAAADPAIARTDLEGRFRAAAVWLPGLQFSHPDFQLCNLAVRQVEGGIDAGRVTLLAGARLRLQVVGPMGQPAAGVQVRLTREATPVPDAQPNGVSISDMIVADDGSAEFQSLPPGQYQLQVQRHPDWWLPDDTVPSFRLQRGQRLEKRVRLSEWPAVILNVRDPLSRPIADARIDDANGRTIARTNPAGIASVRHTGRITVTADDCSSVVLVLDPPTSANETRTIDVTLERGVAISGRLVRPDGTPCDGAWVELRGRRQRNRNSYRLNPDADGRIGLPFVPVGEWELIVPAVDPLDPPRLQRNLMILPGGEHLLGDLVIEDQPRLQVVAVDAAGQPTSFRILLRQEFRGKVLEDIGGSEDGRYRCDALKPGSMLTLVVWSLHGCAVVGPLLVSDEPLDVVRLTLHDYATITGAVLDDVGRPMAGATLAASQSLSALLHGHTTTTDANGRFELRRVLPCRWDFTAGNVATGAYALVSSGDSAECTIWMPADTLIRGRVVGRSGNALSTPPIIVSDPAADRPAQRTAAAADGSFTVISVGNSVRVEVGGLGVRLAVPPEQRQAAELQLPLDSADDVGCLSVSASSSTKPGVMFDADLRFVAVNERGQRTAWQPDPTEPYELSFIGCDATLAPGRYLVVADGRTNHPELVLEPILAEVRAGQTTDVRLTAYPTASMWIEFDRSVSGRVAILHGQHRVERVIDGVRSIDVDGLIADRTYAIIFYPAADSGGQVTFRTATTSRDGSVVPFHVPD